MTMGPLRKHLATYLETPALSEAFPLYAIRNQIPRFIEPHRHDFFEIELVLQGTGENRIGALGRPIGPGALFLGNQFEDHSITATSPITILSIKFSPELLPSAGPLLEPFVAAVPEFRCRLPDLDVETLVEFQTQAEILLDEYGRQKAFWQTATTAALTLLLVTLRRNFDGFIATEGPPCATSHPLVIDILAFFDRHFRRPVTIVDLERHLGYSRAHLNRVFRGVTGQGLKEYLIAKRLRLCCTLLRTTSLAITEVAFSTGFNDISHFNRTFRASMGKSPRQVRQEAWGENPRTENAKSRP